MHRFAVGRLSDQAFSLVQFLGKGFLYRLDECAHLAPHFALQASYYGALAFDDFARALELARMGVTLSFVALQLAFFGIGLLEFDAIGFGHLDHLRPGSLRQLAVYWVCHSFLLHGGVHNHAGKFTLGDQA